MSRIESIVMPKWGMTMIEGTFLTWQVAEGAEIAIGDEVAEVETEKMISSVEAHVAGPLRRQVAQEGEVLRVGAVLGLIAAAEVSDAELDAYLVQAAELLDQEDEVDAGPQHLTVGGALGDLHGISRGDGEEVVVLLHGFSGDALNWRFVIDDLAASRRVIAIDLPGHGDSTKEVGTDGIEGLVASVIEVLDAEGIESADLVGHSLGGLVAARLAASNPGRVSSLALIAPAGLGREIDAEFLSAVIEGSSRRELKAGLQKLFADKNLVTRDLTEEVLAYKRQPGAAEALAEIGAAFADDGGQLVDAQGELAGLDLPLLVIWGAEDEIIPSAHATAAPAGAQVELLPDVGHSPHVESPAEVAGLINRHLERRAR